MHVRADQLVVHRTARLHHFIRQCREQCRARVVARLLRCLGTRNHARDRIEHQDPTERELRERGLLRHESPKTLHRLQTNGVRHA